MACLISRGDTFVLTGGKDGRDGSITSRVSLYSSAGWVRDLASLNTARALHGCASYTDSYGLEVRMVVTITMFTLDTQVLLVAGGMITGDTKTATTEILRTIDGRWTMARNLPHTVYSLSGATLDNTVFMTGECRSL